MISGRVLRDPSHPPGRCPCTMVRRAVGVRGHNEFRASPLLIAHSDGNVTTAAGDPLAGRSADVLPLPTRRQNEPRALTSSS
jgi:hypothetical protein